MDFDDVARLISHTSGTNFQILGETILDRAIRRRMEALGIGNERDYFHKVHLSPRELHELIEEIVVPETWFFRDDEPFNALADYVLNEWHPRSHGSVLRILSVPCSTGEEPYSIAMVLLGRGLPAERFLINAFDISRRALEHAKKALYREKAFRCKDLSFRDIFFTKKEKGYLLKETVRSSVTFHHGNLLTFPFMEHCNTYDIIFCRNLFIYLNDQARERILSILRWLIKDEGLLITGHAELGFFEQNGFTQIPVQKAFALRRNTDRHKNGNPFSQVALPSSLLTNDIKKVALGLLHGRKNTGGGSTTSQGSLKKLEKAYKLADKGNLREAASLCEDWLAHYGPDGSAYLLLGLIRDIEGKDEEAFSLLRKVVYMNPTHLEALLLLAMIAEKLGDKKGAANYRRRAERLKKLKLLENENGFASRS